MRLLFPALTASCSEYHRFHGMLIGPAGARRCIESFNGTILFMPASCNQSAFEVSAERLPYEVTTLTMAKYYLLVIASFTGLCSLLRQTETLAAGNVADDSSALPCNGKLKVNAQTLECLAHRAGGGAVRLVRKFEFRFRLIGLCVAMYHFSTGLLSFGEERLSLVEVYDLDWKVCGAWAWAVALVRGERVLKMLLP